MANAQSTPVWSITQPTTPEISGYGWPINAVVVSGQVICSYLSTGTDSGADDAWVFNTSDGSLRQQTKLPGAAIEYGYAGFGRYCLLPGGAAVELDMIGTIPFANAEGAMNIVQSGNLTFFSSLMPDMTISATYCYDAGTVTQIWMTQHSQYSIGSLTDPKGCVGNGIFYQFYTSTLLAFDVLSGSIINAFSLPSLPIKPPFNSSQTFQTTQTFFADGFVYVPCTSGVLQRIDVATGLAQTFWTLQSGAAISSPICLDGAVFVGDANGNIYSIATGVGGGPAAGTLLWQLALGGDASRIQPTIEDGILYVSAQQIYAIALPAAGAQPGNIVSYDTNGGLLWGVDNGVIYCSNLKNTPPTLDAVALGSLDSSFFAESELLANSYSGPLNSAASQPQTSTFRTDIQLTGPGGDARLNKPVKIWTDSTTPVTITIQGQVVSISSAMPAWTSTDYAGEISLVTPALNISSPAYYLWGNFMAAGESIVIYPDHDLLETTSTIDGPTLSAATSYDGTPLLSTTYQSSAAAIASSVQNTLGNAPSSLAKTRQRVAGPGAAGSERYISFPKTQKSMIYQASAEQTGRQYAAGDVPNWTLDMTGGGGASFTPSGSAPTGVEISWSDFDHFVSNVVQGVENVAQIVATTVDSAVTHWITTAENTYSFVVSTLEIAASVAASILKTVAGALERVVEALSKIFDLAGMSALQKQLSQAVQTNIQTFQTNLQADVSNQINTVTESLNSAKANFAAWAATFTANNSGTTIQSSENNNNDPQTIYGQGGGKSYSQSRWLLNQVKSNASNTSLNWTTDSDLMAYIKTTASNQTFSSSSDPQQTLQQCASALGNILKDPGTLAQNALPALVNLMVAAVNATIDAAETIVADVLNGIATYIVNILELFTQAITIPVISDLFGPISLLDLACWVVAIPAYVLSQTSNLSVSAGDGGSTAMFYATLLTDALYGCVVFGADLGVSGNALTGFSAALSAISYGLAFDPNGPTDEFSKVFVSLEALQFVNYGIGFYMSNGANPWPSAIWSCVLDRIWNCAFGCTMFALSFVGAYDLNLPGFQGVNLAETCSTT